MASFTQDQVRQFYVALSKDASLSNASDAGAIRVKSSAEDVWFEYASPNGDNGNVGVVRSDLIAKNKVNYAVASPAKTRKLRKMKVALNPDVNSGAPVAGQDYILRFTFFGIGMGGNENQYIKEGGAYRAKTGDSAAKVYSTLAALAKVNFSRETYPYVTVSVDGTAATATLSSNSGVTVTANNVGVEGNNLKFAIASVSAANAGVVISENEGVTTITASLTATKKTIADLKALVHGATDLVTITGTNATEVEAETTAVALTTGSTTGLVVEEVAQPWVLGKKQAAPLYFQIHSVPIYSGGSQVPWGVVTDVTASNSNVVGNGKITADMEWFYIGERADQYRGINYPDNFETVYLANPSKTYNFIDIEFYYSGDAEDIQKSKKMLTIAVPTDASGLVGQLVTDITNAGITVTNKI